MKRILLTCLAIFSILLASIAIAAAIFYAWTDWTGARHWQAVEAELRARGEPATIADIVPKSIPAEINFAAVPIFAEIATEPDRKKWRISQIHEFRPAVYTGPEMARYARRIDPEFSGSEADAARVILAETAKWKPLLDEVRMASQRPETEWKIDYDDFPEKYARALNELSKALSLESKAYLMVGDQESAFRDVELIFNLSTRVSHPPLLIAHLIRLSILGDGVDAIRFGLEHHAWTATQLQIIQGDLGGCLHREDLVEALKCERAYINDHILALSKAPLSSIMDTGKAVENALGGNADEAGGSEESFLSRLLYIAWELRPSGWTREDQAAASEEVEKTIEAIRARAAFSRSFLDSSSGNSLLTTLRTPGATNLPNMLKSTVERSLYAQTFVDEARTACAIERYRLGYGTLPPTLAALCPEFLSSVPLDPMSGQPLPYRPGLGDSYILYGVGRNQKDDGGCELRLNLEHEKVPSPPAEALDWVWKIGNPS
jgi:hypothetical protein